MLLVRIVTGQRAVGLVVNLHLLEPRRVQGIFLGITVGADGFRRHNQLIGAIGGHAFAAEAAGDHDAAQALRSVHRPRGLISHRLIRPENLVAVFIPHHDQLLVRPGGREQVHRNDLAADTVAVVGRGVVTRVLEEQKAGAQSGGVVAARDFLANDGRLRRRQLVVPVFGFHHAHPQRFNRAAAPGAAGFPEEQHGLPGAGGREFIIAVDRGARRSLGIFQSLKRHEIVGGGVQQNRRRIRDVPVVRHHGIFDGELDDDALGGIAPGEPVGVNGSRTQRIIFFAGGIPGRHVRRTAAGWRRNNVQPLWGQIPAQRRINVGVVHGGKGDGIADINRLLEYTVAIIPHHACGPLELNNAFGNVNAIGKRTDEIVQHAGGGEDRAVAVEPALQLRRALVLERADFQRGVFVVIKGAGAHAVRLHRRQRAAGITDDLHERIPGGLEASGVDLHADL